MPRAAMMGICDAAMVPARFAKYFGSARIPWRLVATEYEI